MPIISTPRSAWLPFRGQSHLWLLMLLVVVLGSVAPLVAADAHESLMAEEPLVVPALDSVLDVQWQADQDDLVSAQTSLYDVADPKPFAHRDSVTADEDDPEDASLTLVGDASFLRPLPGFEWLQRLSQHVWSSSSDTPPDPPPDLTSTFR
jgi:hypothetical protein